MFIKANKWNWGDDVDGVYFDSDNGRQYIQGVRYIILEK